MIQKITSNDYLKRVGNMSAAESGALHESIRQWLSSNRDMLMSLADEQAARLQNVMQMSIGWNDYQCKAWNDGVVLMTAFTGKSETWLPDTLYMVSAKRSIKKVVDVLSSQYIHEDLKKEEVVEKNDDLVSVPTKNKHIVQGKAAIARPKHIDQYIHLLPEATQERAGNYRNLMRELDEARENMRLLVNDENSKDSERERWAKHVSKLDTQVNSIRKELDREWEKLVESGKVSIDVFDNAYLNETKEETNGDVKEKVNTLRAFLRFNRVLKEDKKDEYVERWKEKYKELISIGGKEAVTDAVLAAAERYGINVNEIEL